ncbi:MAG: nickel pincer cofactor biosynthesis protein LarB [Firmicutes bacterium]|nr:nickel pincer cofactor biosynthesis protein LarB [Bacillota bacterium]
MNTEIKQLLENVKNGSVSVDEALAELKRAPFEDIGYAKVDMHRKVRQGFSEVIYGAGKTAEQIAGIVKAQLAGGEKTILITRLSPEKASSVEEALGGAAKLDYREVPRLGIIGNIPKAGGIGKIVIATGGTSDIPVAEEAAVTAEVLGNEVVRLYDVGVAGVHRLLANMELLNDAAVIIAVAGMEGALASVVGGLADCPVIAVPTSVGYGASFGGISALLSMLNSCASGVSVVNIDNGFGAGYMAAMINHMEVRK